MVSRQWRTIARLKGEEKTEQPEESHKNTGLHTAVYKPTVNSYPLNHWLLWLNVQH